jgi:exodeoxyribonuclease VII large subunit
MEKESLIERLREFKGRLGQAESSYIHTIHQRLMLLSRGLRDPRRRIGDAWIRLDELQGRMIRLVSRIIQERRRGLASEARALIVHSPSSKAAAYGKTLGFQAHTLTLLMNRRFREYQMQVSILKERLKDLGPLSVLKRGYSIIWRLPEREILRSAEGIHRGDRVDILLAQGEMRCRVEEIRQRREKN